MSWQATNWAVNQKVGNTARKLLLLVLANYADPDGVCWPSQGLLAEQTGMSLDTVQRQTKKLIAEDFLTVTRPPKRRGQWQTFIYQLNMPVQSTKPQNAARSSNHRNEPAPEEVDPQNPTVSADTPRLRLIPPLRLGRAAFRAHQAAPPGRTQPENQAAQLCGLILQENIQYKLQENHHSNSHAQKRLLMLRRDGRLGNGSNRLKSSKIA